MVLPICVLDAIRPRTPRCGPWNGLDAYIVSSYSHVPWCCTRIFSPPRSGPRLLRSLRIGQNPLTLVLFKIARGRENHRKHVPGARSSLSHVQQRNSDTVLSRVLATSPSHVPTPAVIPLQTSASFRGGSLKTKNGNARAKKPSLPLLTRTVASTNFRWKSFG